MALKGCISIGLGWKFPTYFYYFDGFPNKINEFMIGDTSHFLFVDTMTTVEL